MTSIPAVTDALVTAWTAALPNVSVVDGPLGSAGAVKPQALAVGEGITGTLDVTNMTQQSSSERYALRCLISVAYAGNEFKAARDACLGIFATVVSAVRDLALDNTSVTIDGEFELKPTPTEKGRFVEMTFPVAVFAAF